MKKIGHSGGEIKIAIRGETPCFGLGCACDPAALTYYVGHVRLPCEHPIVQPCREAEGSMTAFVQHAVDNGFAEICFLDHLTITEAARPMTMAVEEVPIYFQAVQHLKRTFADRIAVKAGLEIEFDPRHAGLFTTAADLARFARCMLNDGELEGVRIMRAEIARAIGVRG